MKAYRYNGQSCIQIIQKHPNEAVIEELYVDPDDRGNGTGTALMRATCRDADAEDVKLFVKPHPFGSYDLVEDKFFPPNLTYKQLCAFYRRFGFRFLPKSAVMARNPRGEKET